MTKGGIVAADNFPRSFAQSSIQVGYHGFRVLTMFLSGVISYVELD